MDRQHSRIPSALLSVYGEEKSEFIHPGGWLLGNGQGCPDRFHKQGPISPGAYSGGNMFYNMEDAAWRRKPVSIRDSLRFKDRASWGMGCHPHFGCRLV